MIPSTCAPIDRRSAWRWLAIMACAFVALGRPARAAGPAIVGVEVGFAGHYRVGYWTPVEVALRGGDREWEARVELTVPDGDGVGSRIRSEPFTLAAGEETRTLVYVKFGRLKSDLSVELRQLEQVVARRVFAADERSAVFKPALSSRRQLVLTLGGTLGVGEALGRPRRDQADPVTVVGLDTAARLPTRWYGYEGVDWLVVSAAEADVYAALEPDSQRAAALARWVELGGRLLVAAGPDAPRLFAPGEPLARFLPGELSGPTRLPRTGVLETYSGTSHPIVFPPGRRVLDAIKLRDVAGVVEARDGDLPLVVRAPRAFGTIVFVAVDLGRAPLAEWPGRNGFVARLFDGKPDRGQDEGELGKGAATYLGITDLAGQLRGALDQFAGVKLAHFGLVAGLAFVYVLLIGPLDFLLLRWIKRMEWTWLSFPLIAVSFCGLALALAGAWKGHALRVNQVDLVDVDVAGGLLRGTTWLNVFSPGNESYDLTLAPKSQPPGRAETPGRAEPPGRAETVAEAEGPEVLMSWQGLPGGALGGMEQAAIGLGPPMHPYSFSASLDALDDVPIPIWSTKALTARWQQTVEPPLESRLTAGPDGVAVGSVTSKLPLTLTNCMLASGRWVYEIDELKPGRTVTLRAGSQITFQAVLKGAKLVRERSERKETLIHVNTPYDPASFDVPRILRQMMFYDVSGGRRYTGLSNRYQEFADLSAHLALGRAVLWALVEDGAGAAELRRDGQRLAGPDDRHWTLYRFVLPVDHE
ncbi:MAG TPA: hypothetical protein VMV69_27890 [Pirellulales bacterium]|nr:hypothetical protein [Pirellulales bacterium]